MGYLDKRHLSRGRLIARNDYRFTGGGLECARTPSEKAIRLTRNRIALIFFGNKCVNQPPLYCFKS